MCGPQSSYLWTSVDHEIVTSRTKHKVHTHKSDKQTCTKQKLKTYSMHMLNYLQCQSMYVIQKSWNLGPYRMHMLNYLQCQCMYIIKHGLVLKWKECPMFEAQKGEMKTGIKIQMSESYLVTSPRPDMICFTPAPADRQHIDHTVRNQGPFLFQGLKDWLCELRQGSVRLFVLAPVFHNLFKTAVATAA